MKPDRQTQVSLTAVALLVKVKLEQSMVWRARQLSVSLFQINPPLQPQVSGDAELTALLTNAQSSKQAF